MMIYSNILKQTDFIYLILLFSVILQESIKYRHRSNRFMSSNISRLMKIPTILSLKFLLILNYDANVNLNAIFSWFDNRTVCIHFGG